MNDLIDFETMKIDLNQTMKILCEEFSVDEMTRKSKKKKSRRRVKVSDHSSMIINQTRRLIPSQSCPVLFSSPVEQRVTLSSSLETLVSTRDCVCQEIQQVDECRRLTCIRCSSTRTDLGYSSGRLNKDKRK